MGSAQSNTNIRSGNSDTVSFSLSLIHNGQSILETLVVSSDSATLVNASFAHKFALRLISFLNLEVINRAKIKELKEGDAFQVATIDGIINDLFEQMILVNENISDITAARSSLETVWKRMGASDLFDSDLIGFDNDTLFVKFPSDTSLGFGYWSIDERIDDVDKRTIMDLGNEATHALIHHPHAHCTLSNLVATPETDNQLIILSKNATNNLHATSTTLHATAMRHLWYAQLNYACKGSPGYQVDRVNGVNRRSNLKTGIAFWNEGWRTATTLKRGPLPFPSSEDLDKMPKLDTLLPEGWSELDRVDHALRLLIAAAMLYETKIQVDDLKFTGYTGGGNLGLMMTEFQRLGLWASMTDFIKTLKRSPTDRTMVTAGSNAHTVHNSMTMMGRDGDIVQDDSSAQVTLHTDASVRALRNEPSSSSSGLSSGSSQYGSNKYGTSKYGTLHPSGVSIVNEVKGSIYDPVLMTLIRSGNSVSVLQAGDAEDGVKKTMLTSAWMNQHSVSAIASDDAVAYPGQEFVGCDTDNWATCASAILSVPTTTVHTSSTPPDAPVCKSESGGPCVECPPGTEAAFVEQESDPYCQSANGGVNVETCKYINKFVCLPIADCGQLGSTGLQLGKMNTAFGDSAGGKCEPIMSKLEPWIDCDQKDEEGNYKKACFSQPGTIRACKEACLGSECDDKKDTLCDFSGDGDSNMYVPVVSDIKWDDPTPFADDKQVTRCTCFPAFDNADIVKSDCAYIAGVHDEFEFVGKNDEGTFNMVRMTPGIDKINDAFWGNIAGSNEDSAQYVRVLSEVGDKGVCIPNFITSHYPTKTRVPDTSSVSLDFAWQYPHTAAGEYDGGGNPSTVLPGHS